MYYLTVLQVDGKCLLLLNQPEKGGASISAKPTLESALEPFKGFGDWLKGDYTQHMSSCFGLVQINPAIIKWEKEAEDIVEYIVNPTPFRLTTGTVSGLANSLFVEVKREILEFAEKTVFQDAIEKLYN